VTILNVRFSFILLGVSLLAACASSTGVLSKGNDVYTISVSRGDAGKVKLRAYQHAEKYCAKKQGGKSILVVDEKISQDSVNDGNMARIDLDFKCIPGAVLRGSSRK
jgi:hypothetical protein